jgi:NitT/TauT family transport system permease protein
MSEPIAQPIPLARRLYENGTLRKIVLLVALALVWEGYARIRNSPLLFPTLTATVEALMDGFRFTTSPDGARQLGELPQAIVYTLTLLFEGYLLGLLLAALLTACASVSRIGADLLEILTSMFNPLPSIALLPLALIWFGLGRGSVVFVLVHAVLWSVALNTHAGFRALSPTLRMVGQNYGLSAAGFITKILIPGA